MKKLFMFIHESYYLVTSLSILIERHGIGRQLTQCH